MEATPAKLGETEFSMDPELQVALSGGLTFGMPLILALRELVVLRRPPGGSPPGPAPDHEPKPLPACLLVPPRPRLPAGEKPKAPILEPV